MASTSKASIAQPPPPLLKPKSIIPNAPAVVPSFESLPVNKIQVEKALTALLAHLEKAKSKFLFDLLQDEQHKLSLVVGLKKVPSRPVHKPIRLSVSNPQDSFSTRSFELPPSSPLKHALINPKESPVTLFVKDPQRQYKDLLETSDINFISRVVGLDKLRNKHKTFEAKRALLKEAELFLVDDRVVIEVGKAIGKMFREANKQPVPTTITRKDLKAELERAVSATYVQVNTGTTFSIKFGSTGLHTPEQLLDNLLCVIPQLAVRLPFPNDGFDIIQTLHIKSTHSTALPIYNVSLDDQGRFKGPSQAEIEVVQAKKEEKERLALEKQKKELEKEKRRIERSATKTGKGRAGKRDADAVAAAAAVQEVEPVQAVEAEQPKKKKSKKSKD
ncbi:BQ5605_C015g07989 [Microbotryum silenes-dioicae]|uniref:BQ5605_C015g07989 protein n=1 Tax=Microbotryum silenes-dioicae TaxID=796604 RepID=A0A2X0LXH1_9BASI|nr:BQ5605_C015g07989 [Microbotryum silenes-dioicae]